MVAKNHCLSYLKSKKGKYYEEVDGRIGDQIVENSQYDDGAEEVPVEWLQEGLGSLNDGQRRCLTLFYLEKKSYQQICDVTGYNLLQVKSHIQNGKRNLKIYIEKKIKERDLNHG
jgi:RNA polymerase sigma-70 factor (ECF subfamily)